MPNKPRTDEIDWNALKNATRSEPAHDSITHFLDRAKDMLRDAPVAILPPETLEAIGDSERDMPRFAAEIISIHGVPDMLEFAIQLETDAPGHATGCVVFPIKETVVAIVTLGTLGVVFYDPTTEGIQVSGVFATAQTTDENVRLYAKQIWTVCIICRALMLLPETVEVVAKPARRVLRKGRNVKSPAYTLVHLHPGAVRDSYIRIREEAEGAGASDDAPAKKGGWTNAQHKVSGFWTHRGTFEDCVHDWEPLDSEDGKRRNKCANCGGRRTWVESFLRGDSKKPTKQRGIVVHIN